MQSWTSWCNYCNWLINWRISPPEAAQSYLVTLATALEYDWNALEHIGTIGFHRPKAANPFLGVVALHWESIIISTQWICSGPGTLAALMAFPRPQAEQSTVSIYVCLIVICFILFNYDCMLYIYKHYMIWIYDCICTCRQSITVLYCMNCK
jgi:hypothetical protein